MFTWEGKGGSVVSQLLILSQELPKIPIPCVHWRGGGGGLCDYVRHLMRIWGELPNFDKNFSDSERLHHRQSSAETNQARVTLME